MKVQDYINKQTKIINELNIIPKDILNHILKGYLLVNCFECDDDAESHYIICNGCNNSYCFYCTAQMDNYFNEYYMICDNCRNIMKPYKKISSI